MIKPLKVLRLALLPVILASSPHAFSSGWEQAFDVPEGQDTSKGIPCGAGPGWVKCAYPEPEPKEVCRLDTTAANVTMVVHYFAGMGQNALPRKQIWWEGKKMYDGGDMKYVSGRKSLGGHVYKQTGNAGNVYWDIPHLTPILGNRKGSPSVKPKDRLSLTNLQNNVFWAVCRS